MALARLVGKTAVISGAARGIGEAHARIFAAEGAKVIVADIEKEAGSAVADSIRVARGEAVFAHLDVTDEASWSAVVKFAHDTFGSLTTLINNAGIYHFGGLESETIEAWNRMIAVDQTGVFLGMRAAMPYLRRSGNGAIVNISSVMGLYGLLPCFSYHTAKAAVRMMSKTAALEYGAHNVRVNSIYPGSIDTSILAGTTEEDRKIINASIPMRRLGKPEDIAYASLYLCSDEALYVTGAELSVDGGLYPG